MKYAQISECDIANGEGIRVSLFVTGCSLDCPGCFNKNYQDFNFGLNWSEQEQNEFINLGQKEFIDGYSILGGEPLLQGKEMLKLVKSIRSSSGKSIWLWTGLIFEELNELQREIMNFIDVLIDGPFKEEQRDSNIKFRGSKNQRIIDVHKTLLVGEIVEWIN
jgi:anaerobic ribonucleoside-triphosphate reductase activating protein